MRFVFLGTGTSSGVPAIGCDCAVCRSSDPRDRRLRTSAALIFNDAEGAERTILIDCGPDFREQALRAGLPRLDAILLTHNHVDHTWGLDEVRRFNAIMGQPIDLFADERTIQFVRHVYRHIFDRKLNVNESFVASFITRRVQPLASFDLFGLRITPLPLLHGKLPVLGFRIEEARPPRGGESAPFAGARPPLPLAYMTDVSGVPPETWPHLRGLRTLVLDGLRHRRHPTHFTVGQAVSVAREIGAEATWLVHMSHDLPHATTDAELPEGIRLACDGLELGPGVDSRS
jgi:phosphoribosyl 1,2-cyclic phosphate phosphodiesterase